ncbi:MAG: thermonuclease family protein [Pseudolabrys sp.]
MRSVPGAILAVTVFTVACSAAVQSPCKFTSGGTAAVADVRDGRTIVLADGRELRLAAVEVTENSRGSLQSLVGGRDIRWEPVGSEPDRYGRLMAFIFTDEKGQSVQEMMLEQGQARVSARVGEKACANALLAAERAARGARRGLWSDPNFAPLRSENPGRIAGMRGQFALVEGKVLSVRESGATIYLNFGPRRTRDFTVTVLKRHRRDFAAAGVDPNRLEGQQIRVRGWVEQRTGPVIEAAAPEQIELSE